MKAYTFTLFQIMYVETVHCNSLFFGRYWTPNLHPYTITAFASYLRNNDIPTTQKSFTELLHFEMILSW